MSGIVTFAADALVNYSEHRDNAERFAAENYKSDLSLTSIEQAQRTNAFAHTYTAAMISMETNTEIARLSLIHI